MGTVGIEHRANGTITSDINVYRVVTHQGHIHTISNRERLEGVFGHLVLDSIGLGIRPG